MKTNTLGRLLLLLTAALLACKQNNNGPDPQPDGNLGTFAGNIQVTDDPQNKLGHLYNVKVTVSRSGSAVTVKVVGDPGFDREYAGTVASSAGGSYDIPLSKQTKPAVKTVGERVVIIDNKLTLAIDIANDNMTVRKNPTTADTFPIAGKLSLIGTDLLRE